MKKNIFCFFLFCFSFFCIPKLVLGEIEHNIVYFVDSFNLSSSNDYIIATGYSYISHQDNRGGTGGNLTTSLIAYVGKWDDKYLNCDNSSNGNCFKMQNLDYSGVDHYSLRCTNDYCSTSWRSKLNQKALSDFDEDGSECFNPDASHCIYKNVGFKFRIDLKNLYNFFGFANKEKTEQLSFRIYSKTNSRGDSDDFGVFSGVCKKDNAVCGKNVSTKSFKFNLEGLADQAQMDAVGAYIQNSSGESIKGSFWKPIESWDTKSYIYDILQIGGSINRRVHYADWSLTTEGERIIQLSGNGLTGWAYSTWLKLPGNLRLKINTFTPNYVTTECKDYSNLSSNEKTKNNNVSCGSSATYKQCTKPNGGVSGEIYISTSSGECSLGNSKTNIGGKYYVVVTVKTDILYYQEAKFTYGNVSSQKVYAGKGFEFSGTVYSNTISWLNANKYGTGEPYYSYDGTLYVNSNNKCTLSDTFDITGASKYYYKDENGNLKSGDLNTASFAVIDQAARKKINTANVENIKFKSCDSNNLDNCNETNPSVSVSGSWTQQGSTAVSDYKISGRVFGKTISSNFVYSLADSYVKVSGSGAGNAYYGTLADKKASLYQATGQKYYIEYRWTESRGKFPFNLASNINPSLLTNMTWSLNGTCKIEVEDGLYRDGSGGGNTGDIESNVVYRPIDLENPFPNAGNNKNKIPVNWRDWYCGNSSNCSGNRSNKLRLSTTYNNYPDNPLYEVNLVKLGKNGLKISTVNNYTTKSYVDTSGINADGTSNFILKFNKYFKSPSVGDKSFCPLGYVDSSCDVIP